MSNFNHPNVIRYFDVIYEKFDEVDLNYKKIRWKSRHIRFDFVFHKNLHVYQMIVVSVIKSKTKNGKHSSIAKKKL